MVEKTNKADKSKPLTPAQRKARERKRKSEAGLKQIEVWVYPEDEPKIRELERELREKRE